MAFTSICLTLGAVAEQSPGALLAHPETIWQALFYTLLFGLLGILLTVLGFKIFDWIHPNMHVEKELAEKQNIAVAIVMAAIILGISLVIAVAIHG
jgi:putative membrane protein